MAETVLALRQNSPEVLKLISDFKAHHTEADYRDLLIAHLFDLNRSLIDKLESIGLPILDDENILIFKELFK